MARAARLARASPVLPVLGAFAVAVTVTATGCGGERDDFADLPPEQRSYARGVAFLIGRQADDGGFHSQDYGLLKPGYSLTAIALYAIGLGPEQLRTRHATEIARAFDFLRAGTDRDGVLGTAGLSTDYPNYAAAFYLLALRAHEPPGWRELAEAQIAHLRRVQLTEALGWQPDDLAFGAFGLGGHPQRKPFGEDLVNLSVTSWVLEGLSAHGVPPGDGMLRKARAYVARCQSFGAGRDGGFFFTPVPEFLTSKAGRTQLADGREVPRSYGSATCDGIRALTALGDRGGDDERLSAALGWLREHFTVERTPGFPAGQQPPQELAVRLYYLATLGRALAGAGVEWPWRAALRAAVIERQHADGSFVGLSPLMKEDDPMVATPLALIGLAASRK